MQLTTALVVSRSRNNRTEVRRIASLVDRKELERAPAIHHILEDGSG